MPYHLKKQSLMQAIGTVYYTGDNRWSNMFSERTIYENKSTLDDLIAPKTRRLGDKDVPNANGAFKTAIIVEE